MQILKYLNLEFDYVSVIDLYLKYTDEKRNNGGKKI